MEERMKKTLLEDFAVAPKGQLKVRTCSRAEQELKCLCQEEDELGRNCFKCGAFVHHCLEKSNNRGNLFECASCLNAALDPLFRVHKVFVQSYFRIENIFQCLNQITFQFVMGPDDLFRAVEIRALKPGQTSLNYPMLGVFELNQSFLEELRPLKTNSNRKSRREEFIVIPKERLRIGKNLLRFKIPVIDKLSFTEHYQYEEYGTYYLSINSINEIQKEALIKETFATRRLEKVDSLALLRKESGDIEVTQSKLCLVCPYTKQRIKIPVRGKYCQHFNCICLQTLIASHYKSRYWGCPICDSKISEPYIDIWIYQMLRNNSTATDVLVQADGIYQWLGEQQEPVSLQSQEEKNRPSKLFNPVANQESQVLRQAWVGEQMMAQLCTEGGESSQKQLREELKQKLSKMVVPKERVELGIDQFWGGGKMLRVAPVVEDIKQLKVREQSYNSFRKKNLQKQQSFWRKMEDFLEEHPNLKVIFKQALS